MPNLIDLTGQRYDKLTVIKRGKNTPGGRVKWICKCDCGNTVNVLSTHLRTGHTRSCGCLQKEFAGNMNFIDITGNKYNKLTVIKRAGSTKKGHALWECKCDCGNITEVSGIDLRSGHVQSCGCLKSKGEELISSLLASNNIKYETQKTFATCRFESQTLAKFDFFIPQLNYLIEYDGIQHFKERKGGNWGKFDLPNVQKRDTFKNEWCKQNNIPLIRIPYTILEELNINDLLLETTKYRVV